MHLPGDFVRGAVGPCVFPPRPSMQTMNLDLSQARIYCDAAPASEPVSLPTESGNRLADVVALAAGAMGTSKAVVTAYEDGRIVLLADSTPGIRQLPRDHPAARLHGQHCPLLVLPDGQLAPERPGTETCTADVQFYAGIALYACDGTRLGTLAVSDRAPRDWPTPAQLETLTRLGRLAAALLEQRHTRRNLLIAAQVGEKAFDGVIVADQHGRVRSCNRAAVRLFGNASLVGQPLLHLFPLRLQADGTAAMAWLAGDGEDTQHLRILGPDGTPRLLDATRCVWQHEYEQGITLVLHDVTEASTQRAQLDRLAHFDALTGLPNRNALLAALEAHADERCWGVALIAIDRFKWINDSLGHAVGDRVLQMLAGRLQVEADAGMCVARIGGDEFAIACCDERLQPAQSGAAGTLLQRLLQRLAQPLHVQGHEIQVEASVGVALRADVQASCDLLACADLALYRAKAAGGRQERHYHPAMRVEALARRELDLELRRAFAQGEFELHYQPQIDLGSGRICGAEALLRWRHPRRGLVSAIDFIDALARGSLGIDVGGWVLERACRDAADWPGGITPVSVNLFPAQLGEHLIAQVDAALAASGLAPARLELEITETIAFDHDSAGARALAQLRERGVRLAFDDFGTGYASLSMLQRFEIDRVKIDRSFVGDMLANPEDAAIVRWIVMLGRNLGLRVVAEGVEHGPQAEWLRELGCDEAQGFLYAPALVADEIHTRLLAQHPVACHG